MYIGPIYDLSHKIGSILKRQVKCEIVFGWVCSYGRHLQVSSSFNTERNDNWKLSKDINRCIAEGIQLSFMFLSRVAQLRKQLLNFGPSKPVHLSTIRSSSWSLVDRYHVLKTRRALSCTTCATPTCANSTCPSQRQLHLQNHINLNSGSDRTAQRKWVRFTVTHLNMRHWLHSQMYVGIKVSGLMYLPGIHHPVLSWEVITSTACQLFLSALTGKHTFSRDQFKIQPLSTKIKCVCFWCKNPSSHT